MNIGGRKFPQYKTLLDENHVTEFHARRLAEEILKYNLKHPAEEYKEYAKDKCVLGGKLKSEQEFKQKTEISFVRVDISNYSTEELVSELKRRGYTGELQKVKTVKL